jgi:integrase
MRAKVYERKDRKGTRFFVYLYWKGQRKKRYDDIDGTPLEGRYRAERLAHRINGDIEENGKNFDLNRWFGKNANELIFANYVKAYIDRKANTSWSMEFAKVKESHAKNHWVPFFQDKDIREIKLGHLEDFLAFLPAHLQIGTKKSIMDGLRGLFFDAHRREDIDCIPPWPKIKVPEKPVKYLEPEQQDLVIAEFAQENQPIGKFMKIYGLRPVMARRDLFWTNIDFSRGLVTIERTKNKRPLELPLIPEAEAILRSLRGRLSVAGDESDLVFKNKQGRPYTRQWLERIWRRANKKAHEKHGVPIVTLYQGIKHSKGTQLHKAGADILTIAAIFGHQKLESSRRYVNVDKETLKSALGVQLETKENRLKARG